MALFRLHSGQEGYQHSSDLSTSSGCGLVMHPAWVSLSISAELTDTLCGSFLSFFSAFFKLAVMDCMEAWMHLICAGGPQQGRTPTCLYLCVSIEEVLWITCRKEKALMKWCLFPLTRTGIPFKNYLPDGTDGVWYIQLMKVPDGGLIEQSWASQRRTWRWMPPQSLQSSLRLDISGTWEWAHFQ